MQVELPDSVPTASLVDFFERHGLDFAVDLNRRPNVVIEARPRTSADEPRSQVRTLLCPILSALSAVRDALGWQVEGIDHDAAPLRYTTTMIGADGARYAVSVERLDEPVALGEWSA